MRNKLASSIAILLNYGAKWRLLYYIFYVLCLDLELSIILDRQTLHIDSMPIDASESYLKSRFKGTFLDKDSSLYYILNIIRPDYRLYNSSSTAIMMELLLVLVFVIVISVPHFFLCKKTQF